MSEKLRVAQSRRHGVSLKNDRNFKMLCLA